jgi:hypothetical protein
MEFTKQMTYNMVDLDNVDIGILKVALELYIAKCEHDKNISQAETMLSQIKAIAYC